MRDNAWRRPAPHRADALRLFAQPRYTSWHVSSSAKTSNGTKPPHPAGATPAGGHTANRFAPRQLHPDGGNTAVIGQRIAHRFKATRQKRRDSSAHSTRRHPPHTQTHIASHRMLPRATPQAVMYLGKVHVTCAQLINVYVRCAPHPLSLSLTHTHTLPHCADRCASHT
jgi:hypothetical protein